MSKGTSYQEKLLQYNPQAWTCSTLMEIFTQLVKMLPAHDVKHNVTFRKCLSKITSQGGSFKHNVKGLMIKLLRKINKAVLKCKHKRVSICSTTTVMSRNLIYYSREKRRLCVKRQTRKVRSLGNWKWLSEIFWLIKLLGYFKRRFQCYSVVGALKRVVKTSIIVLSQNFKIHQNS